MSRTCQLTGKRALAGNNVSHSKRRTRRTQKPNLQLKNLLNPATGKKEKVLLATSMLRTLKKWDAAGKVYDLLKMKKA
ncbi:50S ribosomal protein L28 [Candidatus Uhrbacteria bacterium CG10_big_fil_rev_8_21_14_0_10_50_16]|uniref:Large ribosomal subunit protein bL28 n=1 Tax=Candidatus Uhrbacteria bacterium CG10_big_fil_rev_8_21_14_0_10_50_16 TaxID=1975039 RepID=A0A2H0RLP1_9BACT|nr:MAG: 50S ribosomal protein L28 [Candidatus Uhrbacteria bacterium CG10_big_fil_rev_8_21_14_0_10_50_16]